MSERGIPLASMDRILKSGGAERVADSAKEELRTVAMEVVQEIGRRAVRFAEHADRKTIKEEDIHLASQHIF